MSFDFDNFRVFMYAQYAVAEEAIKKRVYF